MAARKKTAKNAPKTVENDVNIAEESANVDDVATESAVESTTSAPKAATASKTPTFRPATDAQKAAFLDGKAEKGRIYKYAQQGGRTVLMTARRRS